MRSPAGGLGQLSKAGERVLDCLPSAAQLPCLKHSGLVA